MITNEQILSNKQLAGRVVRWHTWPMIRKPTVAEHENRVMGLYVEVWGMPRAQVLYYCGNHDKGEQTAGDTPYGAKRLSPKLAEGCNEAEKIGLRRLGIKLPKLTAQEFKRFKACDLLEMLETALVELNMGNKYAEASIGSCFAYLDRRDACHNLGDRETLNKYLIRNYNHG